MKLIDRYVIGFAIAMALYTILFRSLLSGSLNQQQYYIIWLYSIVYTVAIAVTGMVLGRAHSQGNFLFDMGLPFGIGGFIAWGLVSLGWFRLGLASAQESVYWIYFALIVWASILVIQFLTFAFIKKGYTLKGMLKSDIFS